MPAFTNRFLALLSLLVGLESQALTLGRIQGAPLIGRGLDVSIQVQLDPGQSISSPCFEADVFHADTRQDPARVQVRVEPTQSPQAVRLRILSENRIDEPIVTVYVRAGCANMISRRYVLLADIVSEQAVPLAPRVGSVPLVTPSATGAAPAVRSDIGATVAAARTVTEPEQPVRDAPRPKAATTRPAQQAAAPSRSLPARPAPRTVAAPKAPAAAAPAPATQTEAPQASGQSRLRLDPLELLSERVSTLESTGVSGQSEAAMRDARRLDSLEASIKTLVALAARNEASLLEMKTRMRLAQEDRYNNPVVITLAVLLLASLLAIIYLLIRRQRQGAGSDNWWDASEAVAAPAARAAPAPRVDSSPAPLSVPPVSQPDSLPPRYQSADEHTQPASELATQGLGLHIPPGPAQVDVSLVEMSESTFDRLMQSGAVHSAVRATRGPAPAEQTPASAEPAVAGPAKGKRSRINSEELFDIRQRAEFFVSLGQTDQAVQVLESRIAEDGESSPQAFLDLLKLFHSLGLKADYAQVRGDFSVTFNADMPDFAGFTREGRDLEEYPGALDRIIAVWGTAGVLETIESLLYRNEPDAPGEVFDLAAFRDLLTLHAVAQGVRSGTGLSSGAFTAPVSLAVGEQEIDIDLSALIGLGDDSPGDSDPMPTIPASPKSVRAPEPPPEPPGNLIDFDLSEFPIDKPENGRR